MSRKKQIGPGEGKNETIVEQGKRTGSEIDARRKPERMVTPGKSAETIVERDEKQVDFIRKRVYIIYSMCFPRKDHW